MRAVMLWVRAALSLVLFVATAFLALHYQTAIYLSYQARGQLAILLNTQSMESYRQNKALTKRERDNLGLVEQVKRFSTDSLGYLSTGNFTRVFDQDKAPVLWAVTACSPYSFDAYTWRFPLVGEVSYKGYFKKELAEKEYNHLRCQGYDVDLRPVSAWSTLGWFSDPLLSGMLKRSRGGLCNLLFHELFHATYYAPSSVDFNENIASFVAHQTTLRFLRTDTTELRLYKEAFADNSVYNNFMLRQTAFLKTYYVRIKEDPQRRELKIRTLMNIADSLAWLPLNNRKLYLARRAEILGSGNACFIDFQQYESLQDSLERVFNKIYKGNLKKLVQDLKQNRIYY